MNDDEPSGRSGTIDITAYEKNQRKRILSVFLVIIMVASAIFGLINLFWYESSEPAAVFFIVAILCLPTLWLNLRNRYLLSGTIATYLVFILAHYNLVDGAGIRDPGVVAYPLIVLIGSLLFGKPSIPIFTITGIASLVMVVAYTASFETDLDRLIIISVLLIVGAGATWAILDNIESTTNRLKESDAYLRESLEQSRKHLQRINDIIESVPEGVLLLNSHHQIILANQTAQDFLGNLAPTYSEEASLEQIGRFSIDELISSADEEWREVTVGEEEHVFEAAVRPVQNVPPPYRNWVLVLRDVTLERQQQQSIQEQVQLATVGQLATGIAHDFRNILSVISAYSQIVQKRPGVLKQKEYLSVIQDQIKDAAQLIEQILDFGRRTIMRRQPLDAVALIENVIELLQRTLPSSIEIKFAHDPGQYILNADKSRLQQALVNLAVNARDAMPNGGTLVFTLTKEGIPERVTVGTDSPAQEWMTLCIHDTGEGVHPEDVAHIFEPFFTTKNTRKGTGLGLAQVYGIVKQHEGEITVTSEPGKGTAFNLFFPTTAEIPTALAAESEEEVILD
ncbi:MAG: ATP-binding protein, partial [Candidatus Promineifilaceae bacterium]